MLETLVRHLELVRLTAGRSLVLVAVSAGCTGLIEGGEPSKQELASKLWVEQAVPALTAGACFSCHAGQRANVDFIAGADPLAQRAKLMEFNPPAVNLDAPQSSRLLTKGAHEGPALEAGQRSSIQEWLVAEKEAATATNGGVASTGIRTADFTVSLCTQGLPGSPTCPVNEIPLDDLGEGNGIAGARISFVAQAVSSGLYFNNLRLVPGAGGAYIEHPLFVSIPTDPKEKPIADQIDRFFNVKMNLPMAATGEQQQIQGGAAAFANFSPQNKVAVFFKVAKVFQPDQGGGGGGQTGCKRQGVFDGAARAALQASCGNCHQAGNARQALDLTGIGTAPAMSACNQTRLRLNLQAIDQSGIFLATVPGNGNHPFTFNGDVNAHNQFKATLNPWIVAERDAP
jgi:hypothetical protein